ncbi:RNA 2',3'-cyclic phosphodiesterase [Verrucomicrobiota bacterium]
MNCNDTVRAFIAIEISEEVRRNISRLQADFVKTGVKVKWVKPENMHLTLLFFGETQPAAVTNIVTIMDGITQETVPFVCEVSGMGFFGRPKSPRIVWAGIAGDVEILKSVQAGLVSSLKNSGLDLDSKPFVPHLTIGRIRDSRNAGNLISAIEAEKNRSFGRIEVNRLVLVKSELRPTGPIYSLLHESKLNLNVA